MSLEHSVEQCLNSLQRDLNLILNYTDIDIKKKKCIWMGVEGKKAHCKSTEHYFTLQPVQL